MSNYTPTYTNAAGVTKDATHTPVLAADIGTEFDAIQTAVNSKADTASPTLVTPVLGVATATSINKVAITAPATSATLTIADGKTATISNTLTLAGTDSTTMTFPSTSATIARTDAANTFTGTQTFSGLIDASGASAGQIKFPAAQNASADANTLDDYEEGTWTPLISTTGGSVTLTSSSGRATKIGRLVSVQGTFLVNSVAAPTGAAYITGLPYTAGAASAGSASIKTAFAAGLAANPIMINLASGDTQLRIAIQVSGDWGDFAPYFVAGAELNFSCTYTV